MKRLYRSETNQMIGGVCGGIGEYFDIDPTIIRLVFALVMFSTIGFGSVIYLVCWAIIPSKSSIKKDSEDVVRENATEIKKKFDTFTSSVKSEMKSDTQEGDRINKKKSKKFSK